MNKINQTAYVGIIPKQNFNTIVNYKITVTDNSNRTYISEIFSYKVIPSDIFGPDFIEIYTDINEITSNDRPIVYADITDQSGIDCVIIEFNAGFGYINNTMSFSNGLY